jgi:hypothetical protein
MAQAGSAAFLRSVSLGYRFREKWGLTNPGGYASLSGHGLDMVPTTAYDFVEFCVNNSTD